MMKAQKVIDALEKEIARLKKFSDENVSAFVFIIPPAGRTINFVNMDEDADAVTFYRTLAQRITNTLEDSQRDGVIAPGSFRR